MKSEGKKAKFKNQNFFKPSCSNPYFKNWQCICAADTPMTLKRLTMKRFFLSVTILISTACIASAQTSGNQTSDSSAVSNTAKPKKGKMAKDKKIASDTLDSRKMYNWKNGQRATPTGHEATGTGSGYSAIRKDSATHKDTATAPRDSTRQ